MMRHYLIASKASIEPLSFPLESLDETEVKLKIGGLWHLASIQTHFFAMIVT